MRDSRSKSPYYEEKVIDFVSHETNNTRSQSRSPDHGAEDGIEDED